MKILILKLKHYRVKGTRENSHDLKTSPYRSLIITNLKGRKQSKSLKSCRRKDEIQHNCDH